MNCFTFKNITSSLQVATLSSLTSRLSTVSALVRRFCLAGVVAFCHDLRLDQCRLETNFPFSPGLER